VWLAVLAVLAMLAMLAVLAVLAVCWHTRHTPRAISTMLVGFFMAADPPLNKTAGGYNCTAKHTPKKFFKK